MTKFHIPILILSFLLSACVGTLHHREGMSLIEEGKVEEGLAKLAQAVEAEPGNGEYRKDLYIRRNTYVDRNLATAQSRRATGQFDEAEAFYRRVLGIDPGNSRAEGGLEELARDRRHADLVARAKEALKAGDSDKAGSLLRPVVNENPEHPGARELKRRIDEFLLKRQSAEPTLRGAYGKPVNLEFRDANVRMLFEGLARTTGINFILDKDVRPDLRTTVFLKNAAIEDAIDLILQTSQLQKKILNSNTVLIYPNSPEKLKEYQDLVLKGFYLQNANVKQVQTSLKTLLKTKDMVVDEKLNLIVIRDTPEATRLAEKVVAMHDLAEPEVMLEVEVIEVQRSRLLDLGIQWPNKLTLSPLAATSGGKLTARDLRNLNGSNLGAAISDTIISARSDTTDTNLLANPRIRARNHEKAKVMIGDKVPVVTATTTATGVVSDSVQYLDVGLKLEVEPDIYLQDEVAIKVGMEVSSIVKQVTTPNGTLAYQIGTRNANTVLRLKDGETQILAGLINDQDRRSGSGVPGLSDLPIIGRLFSGQQNNRDKTEIVLSITPHIVRNVQRPEASAAEFWSGTESTLRTKSLTLSPMNSQIVEDGDNRNTSDTGTFDRTTSLGPAKSASLSWQGPAHMKTGETVKLALRMKTDGTVRSLPFQASFDASALQIVEIVESGFFKQDGGSTNFSSNVDPATGRFFVSVTRSDVEGVAGEDTVVIVTLRALTAKTPAEIRLLSATPITQGEKPPAVALPPPHALTITP
jgi:general secretion pathway protein D